MKGSILELVSGDLVLRGQSNGSALFCDIESRSSIASDEEVMTLPFELPDDIHSTEVVNNRYMVARIQRSPVVLTYIDMPVLLSILLQHHK
jgi:hypothetical protein